MASKMTAGNDTADEMLPKMQAAADSASARFLVLTLNGQPLPQTWYDRGDLT